MSVLQYLAELIGNMTPYSHAESAYLKQAYRLSPSGDLAGETPEDCLRLFRLHLKSVGQGDSGLCERSQHLRAVLLMESACPASMPGLWVERYFEEECLRLIRLLCGSDHSLHGLISVRHLESAQGRAGNTMVLFRHEFELHYLNGIGE